MLGNRGSIASIESHPYSGLDPHSSCVLYSTIHRLYVYIMVHRARPFLAHTCVLRTLGTARGASLEYKIAMAPYIHKISIKYDTG